MKTIIIRDADTREGVITAIVNISDDVDVEVLEEAIRKTKLIDSYDYFDLREQIEEALGDDLLEYYDSPQVGDYELWW